VTLSHEIDMRQVAEEKRLERILIAPAAQRDSQLDSVRLLRGDSQQNRGD
jgi:hypothetical protein